MSKQFIVEGEYLEGVPYRVEVDSGGDDIGNGYDVEDKYYITIGYNVCELDENGIRTENVEFYPVDTDMETFNDNHEKVLEHIKRDYPAPEWENLSW